jgi:hypothetical protein
MHIQWGDLPERVRKEIQTCAGAVTGSRPASGARSNITATIETETGPVFIKGASDEMFARSLRNEAATNSAVSAVAPELLWRIDVAEWTVLGFEHVDGRHADYSPDSPDLRLLETALQQLQEIRLPAHISRRVERHYGRLEVMSGNSLLHTDLHPDNVLITNDRAYIVDWAWACRGAPWVEIAMLVFRLMAAGHTIQEAEEWGAAFSNWDGGNALNAFVHANMRSWREAAEREPQDWKLRAAQLAQQWSERHPGTDSGPG